MKIKTITCHHVYNYGASLQAYALQHYLESLGHDVEIIDFNPWFHRARYNPFWIHPNAYGISAKIIKMLPVMKYIVTPLQAYRKGMFKTWGRKKAFDKFEKQYYNLTNYKYLSSDDLKRNPPIANIYVAGSDQIWNTYYENGKEPAYYLDFGDKKTKRISYAASLATSSIKDGYESFVKDELNKFNAISVREITGAQVLNQLGFENISVVLDPVFLLDGKDWEKLSMKGKNYGLVPNTYVLVYDFLGNDDNMIAFIKNYAKIRNLRIVSINDFSSRKYAHININNAGPLEFLSLIKNSACVVASSFHATAFSILLRKEFYTFQLKGDNNASRMKDLLFSIGLSERFNPQRNILQTIDWKCVYSKLLNLKNISKQFLESNIYSI